MMTEFLNEMEVEIEICGNVFPCVCEFDFEHNEKYPVHDDFGVINFDAHKLHFRTLYWMDKDFQVDLDGMLELDPVYGKVCEQFKIWLKQEN